MAGTKDNPKCKICGRYLMEMTVGKTVGQICLVCHTSSFPNPCPHPWRRFPLLFVSRSDRGLWNRRWPTYFPWGLLWPHGRQAQDNHGQTLKRLAERGGLDPVEMLLVIEGKEWHGAHRPKTPEAMRRLRTYRIHWMRRNPKPKGGDQ